MNRQSDEFITLLTSAQPQLRAYIHSLMPNDPAMEDILQETNITLWHKADSFQPGTSFVAWALKVAYFHILSCRRRSRRDRLVFDDKIFDYLSERQADRLEQEDQRLVALRNCLQKLTPPQRQLVQGRYAEGGSVQLIAANENRSVGAISQTLYRIREMLLGCIAKSIEPGGLA